MEKFFVTICVIAVCCLPGPSAGSNCSTSYPADIVFVLDASNSMWLPDFKRQLVFVQNVIKRFDVGKGPLQTRFALLTYGHRVWPQIGLNNRYTKTELINMVSHIRHGRGNRTNTGNALRVLKTHMFKPNMGGRPEAAHIAIVLSDGWSQRTWETAAAAKACREDGIQIFAIGIGRRVDYQELRSIANEPARDYVLVIDGYKTLEDIKEEIIRMTCKVAASSHVHTTTAEPEEIQAAIETIFEPETTYEQETTYEPEMETTFEEKTPVMGAITHAPKTEGNQPKIDIQLFAQDSFADDGIGTLRECGGKPADVFFLLDSSNSIDRSEYDKELKFVKDIVDIFDIGRNKTRIGVLSFSDKVIPEISLTSDHTKEMLLEKIGQTSYISKTTFTGKAIRYVREKGFSAEEARRDVAHVAIVLTDGLSREPEATKREAELARRAGIHMFAIGIGNGTDGVELRDIASKPIDKYVFQVDDFNSLDSIKKLLAIKTCEVGPSSIPSPPLSKLPRDQPAVCEAGKVDLMFVYDSIALGSSKTQMISQYIAEFIARLDMTSHDLHLGRITDNCPSGGNIEFSDGLEASDFVSVTFSTLENLLKKVRLFGFSRENGARDDAAKVAIVFVDGEGSNVDDKALEEFRNLRDRFNIYVISVGPNAVLNRIGEILDDRHFITVPSYETLLTTQSLPYQEICLKMHP